MFFFRLNFCLPEMEDPPSTSGENQFFPDQLPSQASDNYCLSSSPLDSVNSDSLGESKLSPFRACKARQRAQEVMKGSTNDLRSPSSVRRRSTRQKLLGLVSFGQLESFVILSIVGLCIITGKLWFSF